MAYSLVGRSAPMAADDSDDDDQWQDGGEDDVRERTAWQDKHGGRVFGCGKTFGALTIDTTAVSAGRWCLCLALEGPGQGYAQPQKTARCHDSGNRKHETRGHEFAADVPLFSVGEAPGREAPEAISII